MVSDDGVTIVETVLTDVSVGVFDVVCVDVDDKESCVVFVSVKDVVFDRVTLLVGETLVLGVGVGEYVSEGEGVSVFGFVTVKAPVCVALGVTEGVGVSDTTRVNVG